MISRSQSGNEPARMKKGAKEAMTAAQNELLDGVGAESVSRGQLNQTKQPPSEGTTPAYIKALEAAYSAPSQAVFGSAVFRENLKASDDLE